MANVKDLIVNGVLRCLNKIYASEFVGKLTGNADSATKATTLDGLTATVAELNYTDGVTSNIQTQLNGKAASSHTHSYLPLSGGTLTTSTFYGLNIKRSDTNGSSISYQNSNGALGGAGFLSSGDFQISSETNTNGNIFKANTTSATFPGTVTATTFSGSLSGTATTATKLSNTSAIGSATQPVYFNASGVPVAGTYTLGAACAKGVADSSSASAISTGTNLVTERDVYYGLPNINGGHTYNSGTSIYAPTSAGTSGYVLKSSGSGAPSWTDITPVNNLLATTAGKPLDAVQGKTLNDKITAIPTITFASSNPTTVAANTIVMVYE